MRYFYRLVRITHRPTDEDKITVVKEVKENDLQLARIRGHQSFLEGLQDLRGKYSPAGFNSYDTGKGIGLNYQLLLIDSKEEEVYVVESSMEDIEAAVVAQREEEREVFRSLGLDYSELEF